MRKRDNKTRSSSNTRRVPCCVCTHNVPLALSKHTRTHTHLPVRSLSPVENDLEKELGERKLLLEEWKRKCTNNKKIVVWRLHTHRQSEWESNREAGRTDEQTENCCAEKWQFRRFSPSSVAQSCCCLWRLLKRVWAGGGGSESRAVAAFTGFFSTVLLEEICDDVKLTSSSLLLPF